MDPKSRVLKKVHIEDAEEAEKVFEMLMEMKFLQGEDSYSLMHEKHFGYLNF